MCHPLDSISKKTRQRLVRLFVLCTVVIMVTVLFAIIARATFSAGSLVVSFIDVDEGDAALVQDIDGCNILIDGGTPAKGSTVVNYLRTRGVNKIDAVFATHADSDHYGGLTSVLESGDISVTQVYFNGYSAPYTNTWKTFVDAVVSRGLTFTVATSPMSITLCSTHFEVLNPSPLISYTNDNDASVVLLVQHGLRRFLFTGDISSDIDATVIARTSALPIDTLKVSHHGSKNATSSEFLAMAMPKTVVISVGPNAYGHPTTETLTRLGAIGALVLRTDLSGTIVRYDWPTFTAFSYIPIIAVPAVLTSDLRIAGFSGLTKPEVITISNLGLGAGVLTGWAVISVVGPQTYTFPVGFTLAAGASVRVESYTSASNNPPSILLWSTAPIWNDAGDKAVLRDASGNNISSSCYKSACP